MRPYPAFPEGKKQGGILWPQDATSGEILRGNGYYQETIMNIVQNSFPPCFLCNVEVYCFQSISKGAATVSAAPEPGARLRKAVR